MKKTGLTCETALQGILGSSAILSEWQMHDRILPSACVWICISLDVFFVTPTAGRSSKCCFLWIAMAYSVHFHYDSQQQASNFRMGCFKNNVQLPCIAIVKPSHRICSQGFHWPKMGWSRHLKTRKNIWKVKLKELENSRWHKKEKKIVEPFFIPVAILDGGTSRQAGGLIGVEEKTPSSCHRVSDSPSPKCLFSPFNLFCLVRNWYLEK